MATIAQPAPASASGGGLFAEDQADAHRDQRPPVTAVIGATTAIAPVERLS